MRNNAVNIEFLKKRTEKLTEDVEKLIRNGSGKHQWRKKLNYLNLNGLKKT